MITCALLVGSIFITGFTMAEVYNGKGGTWPHTCCVLAAAAPLRAPSAGDNSLARWRWARLRAPPPHLDYRAFL